MKRVSFNEKWQFMDGSVNPMMAALHGDGNAIKEVTLPHDAMLLENRDKNTVNKAQTAFFPGGNYCYIKTIDVSKDWSNQVHILEFEGAYAEAKVYINDDFALSHLNGYSNFYIKLNDYLKYGEKNTIRVLVNNTVSPNSRWYSGSGLYRNVNLFSSSFVYIPVDGVKITTSEITDSYASVEIKLPIHNKENTSKKLRITVKIEDETGEAIESTEKVVSVCSNETVDIHQRMGIKKPKLWGVDHPNLYKCRIEIRDNEKVLDQEEIMFGIRNIKLSATHGFQLNGEEIKLRGTCVHHDNGILGAKTFNEAEFRRVKIMKEAGFNCIRCSHQPMSKAMLKACDELGMLVIDELSDMWNNSKNTNDYSKYFSLFWEDDVISMIQKDFNHPSVIMYCTGNEIKEAGTSKGAQLSREIHNKIKELDPNRYTVSAINALLAASSKLPQFFGELQQMQKQKEAKQKRKENVEDQGSNQLNNLMSLMVGPVADMFATHKIVDDAIEEFEGTTDVVGYNYMTSRHEKIKEKHPEYIVMGAETFPPEIARLWKIVEDNSHVIGDMTWTGFDYLGEDGIGIFYYDGSQSFSNHWPDLVAGTGDIDITGHRRPMSYYREIVYGLRKEPYIAVQRVDRYGLTYTPSPWISKDYLSSWTWNGYEGKPAIVDVFSDADEVELLVNGKSYGKQPAGRDNDWKTSFELTYQSGKIQAVNYRKGIACETMELIGASEEIIIKTNVDKTELAANQYELAFVEIEITDKNGVLNTQYSGDIDISVEGSVELIAYGSANPITENSYLNTTWKAWDGKLLAVVRAKDEKGLGTIIIKTGNYTNRLELKVV